MSIWVETKDGRIVDIRSIGEEYVYGFVIKENDFKLKWGDFAIVKKDEVKEDDVALLQ